MDDNIKTRLMTANIIWLALCMSQLIYVGVGFGVGNDGASIDTVILGALLVMAGVSTVVGLFVIPAIIKVTSIESYFTFGIIRWAIFESVAIYGLMGFMLGGPQTMQWGLTLWALTLMLLARPSEGDFQKRCTTGER